MLRRARSPRARWCVQTLLASITAKDSIASLKTIVKKCSVDFIAELFADKFSRPIVTPRNPSTKFVNNVYVYDPLGIDEDFLVAEFVTLCAATDVEELRDLI